MSDKPTHTWNPETVSFMWELFRDWPSRQLEGWAAIEAKANQIFGVGGVVFGLTALALPSQGWAAWLLVPALLCFVVLSYAAVLVNWPRQFVNPFGPKTLLDEHFDTELSELRYALLCSLADNADLQNATIQEEKGRWLRVAIAAFFGEVLFTTLWVATAALS
jgi:hypothetical protein